MKLTLLSLGFLVVGTTAFLIKVPTVPTDGDKPGSSGWMHKEKIILAFLKNVCDDSTDSMIVRLATDFTLEKTSIKNIEVFTEIQNIMTTGSFLTKDISFIEYNMEHLRQLKVLSRALYFCATFDDFLHLAAWARQNVNCVLFFDAFYAAVIHRRDMAMLTLPAPYELFPNYFIRKDAIFTCSSLLSGKVTDLPSNVIEDGGSYVVTANYTEDSTVFDDSKLAYFREDLGLNTFYFLERLQKAPWFNDFVTTDSRYGEYTYHIMKQLLTRYDLERYASSLGETVLLDWASNCVAPEYDSMLINLNGESFKPRTKCIDMSTENMEILKNIESNIVSVVNEMVAEGRTKSYILNNVMEIILSGDNSYDVMIHKLFALDDTEKTKPSSKVIEHFMTAVRDPAFWILKKKIVSIIDRCLAALPTYNKNELYFPGVEIISVDTKKMMTSFSDFEFDITDALFDTSIDTKFQVKIKQSRLSHKPFSMKVNITSLVSQKALLKIFLGPKILPGEFSQEKNKFMLIDSSEINLKIGANVITRTSDQMEVSNDFPSFKTMLQNIENAEYGLDTIPLENMEKLMKFPSRLLLPKGSETGSPFHVFVFVAPFVKVIKNDVGAIVEFNTATLSPGYPLDLDFASVQTFNLPNAILKEIIIAHKTDKPGTWESGKDGKKFDYKSKQAQYEKSSGYSSNIENMNYKQKFDSSAKSYQMSKFPKDSVKWDSKDVTTKTFDKYDKTDVETTSLENEIDEHFVTEAPKKPVIVYDNVADYYDADYYKVYE